jgi:hypothetical protein
MYSYLKLVFATALCIVVAACGGGGGGIEPVTAEAPAVAVDEGTPPVVKMAPLSVQQVSGAIFTTEVACSGTNINLFPSKGDVYLDGGPRRTGSAGLPPGNYYAKVTDPSGAVILGSTPTASVIVNANGEVAQCYRLWDILTIDGLASGTPGYADTPNNGGEYKVWVSKDPTFTNSETKTDNFKVQRDTVVVDPFGKLNVVKYYDANANGIMDAGETEIIGWKVNIAPGVGDQFTPYTGLLAPADYTVKEYFPVETNWYPTTATTVVASVTQGGSVLISFGNVCTGAGGGKTLGFWSNKNGQALVLSDDLLMLTGLNLRDGSGAAFDPTNYMSLRTWLLNGTAVNMAYMLSVQMAAMQLNVYNNLVNANALIYAPSTNSANAAGFATVSAVLAEANASLGTDGLTPSGHAERAYQEKLKDALDNANNNRTFVLSTPCAFTW